MSSFEAKGEVSQAPAPSARDIGEKIVAETERLLELEAAFFVSLVSNGLPADISELLTYGNAKQGIPPRLIQKAIKATIPLDVERERNEARQMVIEANNSLYGSQGYFHSLDGGPFDRYHLSRGIEKLKATNRRNAP
ncbi:hypothetical protein ABIF68_007827 [Bradyrhizobium japonicum]|uniref:hypothetical protein n=1 Tax=Bradyrhizobium TaxID=374 RepID=UPI000576DC8E|nr:MULTISPECIES: hypothetical protein [Bradyrhizobium]MBR0946699.1 hypothetical protein [Bradyrhizobium liaoningense]MDI2071516.1 hypothetical protein [Bradyrhizobium sp. Mp27]